MVVEDPGAADASACVAQQVERGPHQGRGRRFKSYRTLQRIATMNLKEIQERIGTTPDGVMGPKTKAALAGRHFDVVVDAGHTRDHAREYPREWPKGTWIGPAARILRALGLTEASNESVEHALNVAVGKATAAALEKAGLKVLLYDDPAKGNKAEYVEAAAIATACAPRVFLSLHANGSRGVATCKTNSAWGTTTFYRASNRASSMKLAAAITEAVNEVRREDGAPGNRADKTASGSSYYVLNATATAGASVLCEVGFYDHAKDLEFMADNIEQIGQAIAGAIRNHLNA